MCTVAPYRASCAICGGRDATTLTEWELEGGASRTVAACATCLARPAPPRILPDIDVLPTIAARAIYVARTFPGLLSCEVSDRLGLAKNDATRNAVSSALCRAVSRGWLRRDMEPGHGFGRYYKGAKAWKPTDAQGFRAGRNATGLRRGEGGRWRRAA